MKKTINMENRSFGRLTVESRCNKKARDVMWVCSCSCGNQVIVSGSALRSGNTKSCGCLKKEVTGRKNRVHGYSKERLYKTWLMMRQRTTNPKHNSFHNYGGKGVKVCEEWNDYVAFRKWAFGNGYDENSPKWICTIDRIDSDGNYEPANCRIVSSSVQSRNTKRNRNITFNGKTMVLKDWAVRIGIAESALRARLNNGWSVERAFTTPSRAEIRRTYP